jgi:hypothetical protein
LQATPAQETVSKIVNPPPVAEPEKAVSSPEVSTPVPKQASPAATAPAQQQAPQMKNTRMENIVNGLTSASQKNILVEYQALSKRLLDYTKISNMVKDVFSSTDANWQRFHELKPIVEAIAAQKISDGDPVKKRMAADAQYALAKSEGYLVSAADNKQANKYGDLMQAACKNEQPDAMLETAKANTKKGNQDFAAELFAKILKSNPENDERTYLAQKETRKFLRENGSFLKKHPELVTALKSAQEKINDIDKKSTKSLGITSLINKLLHKDDQPKQEEDIQIKSPGKR